MRRLIVLFWLATALVVFDITDDFSSGSVPNVGTWTEIHCDAGGACSDGTTVGSGVAHPTSDYRHTIYKLNSTFNTNQSIQMVSKYQGDGHGGVMACLRLGTTTGYCMAPSLSWNDTDITVGICTTIGTPGVTPCTYLAQRTCTGGFTSGNTYTLKFSVTAGDVGHLFKDGTQCGSDFSGLELLTAYTTGSPGFYGFSDTSATATMDNVLAVGEVGNTFPAAVPNALVRGGGLRALFPW